MTLLDWFLSWFRPAPAPQPQPSPTPSPGDAVAAVNAARAQHGLKPLAEDPRLTKAASDWAGTMEFWGLMSHSDLTGLMEQLDCPVAECVAESQPDAASVVAAWLGDPPHRAILLGDYNAVGVGHVGAFWCCDVAKEGK